MRKCRQCKSELPKIKDCEEISQVKGFCDLDHMALYGLQKARNSQAKKERKEHKVAKERIKTRGDHAREAQTEFNRFIRLRDQHLCCISCGRHHNGQYHAGHYRTVGGNPELRFVEDNCQKQCSVCNNHKSGNIVEYRINLISRIGIDRLDWLEGPHEPKKYTIDELKAIKLEYRAKWREIEKGL